MLLPPWLHWRFPPAVRASEHSRIRRDRNTVFITANPISSYPPREDRHRAADFYFINKWIVFVCNQMLYFPHQIGRNSFATLCGMLRAECWLPYFASCGACQLVDSSESCE
jgi:hypothetical protein